MNHVIGNIIMLIGSIIMVLVGTVKSKKETLILQTIQSIVMCIGGFVLGGYTSAFSNILTAFRNTLAYKNKLNFSTKVIVSLIAVVFCFVFNNLGIIGYLPVISFLLFTFSLSTENVKIIKLIIIVGCILFCIHDLYIKSYTSFAFNVFTMISTCISLISIQKKSTTHHPKGNEFAHKVAKQNFMSC